MIEEALVHQLENEVFRSSGLAGWDLMLKDPRVSQCGRHLGGRFKMFWVELWLGITRSRFNGNVVFDLFLADVKAKRE